MGIHVVIISSSRDNLQQLSDRLSGEYHLHTVSEYSLLLNVCKKYPVNIILCMEGASTRGIFNLCRRIKNNNRLAHLPVILITGKERMFERLRSLEAGADVHIGGPIFREHLHMEIKNLVANRSRIRRHVIGAGRQVGKKPLMPQRELLIKLNECKSELLEHKKADVKQLAILMHMSRPTLYRKLKGLTDLTPNEWINKVKLERAAELLEEGQLRAYQVARLLGYPSQSSFGKMFLRQFKVTPATFQRMKKTGRQFFAPGWHTIPQQ